MPKTFVELKRRGGKDIVVKLSDVVRIDREARGTGSGDVPVLVLGGEVPARIELDEASVEALAGMLP